MQKSDETALIDSFESRINQLNLCSLGIESLELSLNRVRNACGSGAPYSEWSDEMSYLARGLMSLKDEIQLIKEASENSIDRFYEKRPEALEI